MLEKDSAADFKRSLDLDQDSLRIPLTGWHATGTVWSFFGSSVGPMAGKPEHVDQLRPGVITMHSQICGRKVWTLRPNSLAESWEKVPMLPTERIEISCQEGDQLVLDTAAWYHATNIPGGTGFTWSIAQDFSQSEVATEVESVQLRISQQICQQCLTPTTPPPGSPVGTCGCWCCGQERLKLALWRSFRLSSMLTQRFLRATLGSVPLLLSKQRLLAICDRKAGAVRCCIAVLFDLVVHVRSMGNYSGTWLKRT